MAELQMRSGCRKSWAVRFAGAPERAGSERPNRVPTTSSSESVTGRHVGGTPITSHELTLLRLGAGKDPACRKGARSGLGFRLQASTGQAAAHAAHRQTSAAGASGGAAAMGRDGLVVWCSGEESGAEGSHARSIPVLGVASACSVLRMAVRCRPVLGSSSFLVHRRCRGCPGLWLTVHKRPNRQRSMHIFK